MSIADKILSELEDTSIRSSLPIIGPVKGRILANVLRERKPELVLEVGTLIGYSAILMAKHLPSHGRIISIEDDRDEAEIASANIRRAGFSDVVRVMVGDARAIIPRLNSSFDLVFIDGAKDEYFNYLRLVEPKLHAGSCLVADNAGVFAGEMKDYLNYVRNSGKYKSQYMPASAFAAGAPSAWYPDDDGVEVSVKL